jgi:hypothetical protein
MALTKLNARSLQVDEVGQLGGRRNILINSAFQVNQRGDYSSPTAITTWTYYTDRWKSTTSTVSGTIQYTDNVVKLAATSTGSSARILTTQGVERINIRPSTDYTYSAWVRSNTSNARIIAYINGAWQVGQTHSGNGEWEHLVVNVTSQSSAQPDEVWVRIGIMDGSGNPTITVTSGEYVEAYDIQLEAGTVATPFEHRSYGDELALCQRYYWRSTGDNYHGIGSGQNHTSSESRAYIPNPVDMRANPTIGIVGTLRGNSNGTRDITTIAAAWSGKRANMVGFVTGGVTAGYGFILHHLDNTSNYFYADAEL